MSEPTYPQPLRHHNRHLSGHLQSGDHSQKNPSSYSTGAYDLSGIYHQQYPSSSVGLSSETLGMECRLSLPKSHCNHSLPTEDSNNNHGISTTSYHNDNSYLKPPESKYSQRNSSNRQLSHIQGNKTSDSSRSFEFRRAAPIHDTSRHLIISSPSKDHSIESYKQRFIKKTSKYYSSQK